MKKICVYGAVNDKIDNSFIQAGIELGKPHIGDGKDVHMKELLI